MNVDKYGRFEISIKRVSKTSYPYNETELLVNFNSPNGKQIEFWGFYDGEDTWKIRFMPTEIGIWSYSAYFSDDEGNNIEGNFTCIESNLPGTICCYKENPLWFGFSEGYPFFMRSFHVGDCFFADNWPDSSRIAFLDWAKDQGYNTLSIASFFVNRQTYARGMGWQTPSLWPLDANEYRKAERILDMLCQRGFIIFPFAGFFGREGFNPNAHRDQVKYVRYIIARWGCYRNLLFNVAGPEPILDVNPFMTFDEVNRLGHLIAEHDIYHHMLTVHNQSGDDQFKNCDYQTFTTLQGPKTISLPDLRKGLLFNHPSDGPLYAQETLWTDNIYGHPIYTDVELRRNAYVIALTAAYLNYGDMNGDSSSGFSGRPELERRVQRRHDIVKTVWDNITRFPYYIMKPDDTLAENIYALSDKAKENCLIFCCDCESINLNLSPDKKYDATIIRTDRISPDINTTVQNFIDFPETGDWLVYLKRNN